MARILFVTWDGGGNVPPALGIATELRNRGHRVRFLGHCQQRQQIESRGFPFTSFRHARPWQSTTAHPGIIGLYAYLAVFTDPGPGIDLVDTVTEEPADVVVIDCLLYGAIAAAERTRLGLVTTERDLDPAGRRALPPPIHYTGVVPHPMPPTPTPVGERTPLILVSLSSTNFRGQRRVLQHVLDALHGVPARTVVTTGTSVDPTALTAGPDTEIHGYLDHEQILPNATLVIGHGGHDTTMRALAHDIPLIVLPMHPMLDQKMIGRTLEGHGVARCLRKNARTDVIRAAADDLLTEGPHRTAVSDLGARIRSHNGATYAADLIEHLPHRQAVG
ncbi:glycosyltransferase [Rhodococcus chondri]|uniref:Glycosyltransferase n=1 Tax=Rhodococcus chondri TaxID=3065941 RepID=A0ABU7JX08_9NOCA|nr:nucleotide disphospho-sugar-binding domain-containing protein [Rhodococcus sp. CC-R104]MEE2034532.1 glycosyltransferase [Rhodococcus sp. CC-R104]